MHMFRTSLIGLLALLPLSCLPARGQTSAPARAPVGQCDTLSGMPVEQDFLDLDLTGPRYGKGRTKQEVEAIIAACRKAAATHPKEARFAFRLGIALKHAGRTDEALGALATARELGSVGGWDEAGMMLMLGNSNERGWKSPDPKAGLALVEEGISKTGASVLLFCRAYGLLRGPKEIRDVGLGLAGLRKLAADGDNHARVVLSEYLWFDDGSPARKEEAKRLMHQAIDSGSGAAAARLATWMIDDEDEAHRLYAVGATRGDAAALNGFGFDYEYGRGVKTNFERALDYYGKSARQGYAIAQYNLASLLSSGKLGRRDYPAARRWLEQLLDRDYAGAFFLLGMMYDHGQGIPVDRAKARQLYERGAELGSAASMNNMGYLFEHGRAAPVDLKLAVQWYEKAVARGSGDAMSNLAGLYQKGRGVPRDAKKAFELLTRAADRKSRQGTNNLGYAYLRGEGTEKDLIKARDLFRRAEELGSTEAVHNLATMLEKGQGGERDNDEARRLFKKAAEAGFPNAMYRYAMRVHYDADDEDDDEVTAARITQRYWLKRAVAAGDTYGVKHLAEMLADGIGGAREPREALRLYLKAAEADEDVRQELAERSRLGNGVPRDPRLARRLYGELDSLGAFTALVEMMDRGEGGPRDPKGATEILRAKVAGGDFWLTGRLARRLADGTGGQRDPEAARSLLTLTSFGKMVAEDAYQLGQMRERGEGGPVDLPGAVAAYRKGLEGGSNPARVRLAMLLRRGREGVAADPVEARRLFEQASYRQEPEAVIHYIEMLDQGEGGPADHVQAARQLLTAIITRNPLALDLAMRPGNRLTTGTRSAFADELSSRVSLPRNIGASGPLLTPSMLPALGLAPARRSRR